MFAMVFQAYPGCTSARQPRPRRRCRLDPDAVRDQEIHDRRVHGRAEDDDGGGSVRASRGRGDGEAAEPREGAVAVEVVGGGATDPDSAEGGGRAARGTADLSQGETVRR